MEGSTPESRSEDREKRQEHREERHEAREILSAREADEVKFKRLEDYENLKSIPTIVLKLGNIEKLLDGADVVGTKRDVDWLTKFFWVIIAGVSGELIATIAIVMFKLGR